MPHTKDYQQFFDSGGVAFVPEGSKRKSRFDRTVVRPLASHDTFDVPVCLISNREEGRRVPLGVENYLHRRLRS